MTDDTHSPLTTTADAPHRRRWLVPGIFIAVIVLVIVAFGLALQQSRVDRLAGGPAPDFSLTTFDGQAFKLSEKRGKPVFINFWASWCGPCRSEAPLLNDLYAEYKARGVEFIGITYLEPSVNSAQQFMRETGMAYPAASDDGSKVGQAYRVKGVPQTYMIDRAGNVAFVQLDPLTIENIQQVRASLDKLLAS
jgi:cytochrome c biogenesis protein CcmG/thiol:disulfide interchange protein DsbE